MLAFARMNATIPGAVLTASSTVRYAIAPGNGDSYRLSVMTCLTLVLLRIAFLVYTQSAGQWKEVTASCGVDKCRRCHAKKRSDTACPSAGDVQGCMKTTVHRLMNDSVIRSACRPPLDKISNEHRKLQRGFNEHEPGSLTF